nr:bifunctional riboflavin kinase/FAD synthetase [Paenibacillus phyllosphaerae]
MHYPLQLTDEQHISRPKTIAIGHFDGVHLGHKNVIRRAVESARVEGLQSAVMTFHPHPKEVLGQGDQYVTCLTPLADKIDRFRQLGVDVVYIVQFDLTFAAVTPEAFVTNILTPLHVRRAVVGFDFSFGARGAGTTETLRVLCEPNDIAVDIIDPFLQDGAKVSSTRIRECLSAGEVKQSAQLMGTAYAVTGTVMHGEGRGRTIGFPTANVELSAPYVVPRLGVYAIFVQVDGQRYSGVLNIGKKPTFHDDLPKPVFEAHLFDFAGDLYGKQMDIHFIDFLRAEQKFSSIDQLIAQIHSDAQQARTILSAII